MVKTQYSAIEMGTCGICDLRTLVESQPGTLYAIVHSCEEPRVPQKVSELGDRAISLNRGHAARDCWDIAPYLAQADGALLDWIVENLWNDAWGVFVASPVDLAALRKHLRRFLDVQDPEGDHMYFRFYDPRVMRAFLPTCSVEEIRHFFGPVQAYYLTESRAGVPALVTYTVRARAS